jgi:hypothetical protein
VSSQESNLTIARQVLVGIGDQADNRIIAGKSFVAVFLGWVSYMTLEKWVAFATLIYVVLQIIFLLREKWWLQRKRTKRADNASA